VARANGRFPAAQIIETVPGGDGSTVFLRATFGVLVSRDAGKSWRWVCERALGYEGTWDPPIAVTRDGRLWVGLERGLVSTLDGCTVDRANELTGETVKDLTTDPRGETLWALTGAPDRRGAVWRRALGGAWERVGLVPEGLNPMTLEIAPSRPGRLYVSGQPFETIRGWLLRSDDGGKTFVGGKNELPAEGPFFIAGVDPMDADRVLVRHLHTTGSDVLLTPDGGKTFTNVLGIKSAMYGFAKSADGKTYWAGSGLAADGIYRSTDRGAHFERIASHGVQCLHAAAGGRLYVCENPLSIGAQAIAVSSDEGKTVSPLARFADIAGPVSCGGGDGGAASDGGASLCADAWKEARALLAPAPPGDRGADQAARAAGDGGAASREGGLDAGRGAGQGSARRSSCACGVVGAPRQAPDHLWLTAGLIPLALGSRAHRRRGSARSQPGPSRPR
jgi:hypothetical protein